MHRRACASGNVCFYSDMSVANSQGQHAAKCVSVFLPRGMHEAVSRWVVVFSLCGGCLRRPWCAHEVVHKCVNFAFLF